VARSFSAGFGLVVCVAALVILLTRPGGLGRAPQYATAFASEVRRAQHSRPPPNREDLIRVLCTPDVVLARCEHALMRLYRACGTDLAHPRTDGCGRAFAKVRRSAAD
jgi:hypothetical protein